MPNTPEQAKRRAILERYTTAARAIEIAGAAIVMLEQLHGPKVRAAIKHLAADQQVQLRRLDAAAAQLGAPYPSK